MSEIWRVLVLLSDPRINNDSNDNSNVDDKNNYCYIGCPFDIAMLETAVHANCTLVPDCRERARGGPDEGNNEDEKRSNPSLLLILILL